MVSKSPSIIARVTPSSTANSTARDTIYYLIIVIYYFWYFYVKKNVILGLGDLFPCF